MSFTVMNIIRQLVAYDPRSDSLDDRIRYFLLPIMGVEPLYPGNKTRFDNPKTGKKEPLKRVNEDERLDLFRIANRRIEEYNDEIDSYNTVQLFGNEDKMHEVELKEELPLLNTYGFNVSLTEPNIQILIKIPRNTLLKDTKVQDTHPHTMEWVLIHMYMGQKF